MTINEIKKQFLGQYAMSSENTKTKYKRDLDLFLKVCEIKTVEELNNFGNEQIQKFHKFARENAWGANTTNQRLSIAKIFSAWAFGKNLIIRNYLTDVKKIRTTNEVHYTPTNDDCDLLLDYIQQHTSKKRLYLMAKLLLNSGLRISEICNLKTTDLDKTNSKIRVCGKGMKIVEQPIPTELMIELVDYVGTERAKEVQKYEALGGKDKKFMFLSGIGDSCNRDIKNLKNGNAVNKSSFHQQLKRYAKLAGIQNPEMLSAHALRRRFVTNIYEETGDALIASMAARHNSVETTTKHYINFDQKKVEKAVADVYTQKRESSNFSQDDEYQLFLLLQKKYAQA